MRGLGRILQRAISGWSWRGCGSRPAPTGAMADGFRRPVMRRGFDRSCHRSQRCRRNAMGRKSIVDSADTDLRAPWIEPGYRRLGRPRWRPRVCLARETGPGGADRTKMRLDEQARAAVPLHPVGAASCGWVSMGALGLPGSVSQARPGMAMMRRPDPSSRLTITCRSSM